MLLIEPTNRRNLKCPLCPRNRMKRKVGDMRFEDYKKIIDEMKDVLLYQSEQTVHMVDPIPLVLSHMSC